MSGWDGPIWQDVMAGLSVMGFGVLYQVALSELLWSGLVGSLAWAVVQAFNGAANTPGLLANFLAGLLVAAASELLAVWKRHPAPVYMVPAIIPLVPGLLVYQSIVAFLHHTILTGVTNGLNALGVAGALSVGLALGTALVRGGLRRTPRDWARRRHTYRGSRRYEP